ncbi:PQQ-dependent sugar dehydrogenase [Streptomyces triticirhizae]|uniref:PQQ-dependent sugar dehydrogenase n=1 Tax=Streptomyces triticirhizae TaxID=2483353 RepID=A0A3M2LZA4_9ACTN|nr:PQQ-dependent sugar dehydrogenase [Streptomyces triticirhizae]RMI42260.1 PQQ-dependent sugar dehydrogenase [Streptomyces triticirhizae]
MSARPVAGALLALALTAPLLAGCSSGEEPSSDSTEGSSAGPSEGESAPEREAEERTPGASPAPAEGDVEVVATLAENLSAPWGLAQLPDGSVLLGSRDSGALALLDTSDGEPGTVSEVGEVPGVSANGEGGLLGLALAPDFDTSGRLYAYATTASDNRIIPLELDPSAPEGERLTAGDPLLADIPKGEVIHNGGGLAFGPDGMLYATTGDTADAQLAQDPDSLAGKILRIDPTTGAPPADNPDPDSLVYSLGHRNVQGLAWDAEDRLWAAEFGDDTWDELNLIEPGGNYGWPEHEGEGGAEDGFVDPVAVWPPAEASPSGLAYSGGALWLATLRGERLWRVPLDGTEPVAEPEPFLEGDHGRLRNVVAVGEGELLLLTNETDGRGSPADTDDRLLRLRVS